MGDIISAVVHIRCSGIGTMGGNRAPMKISTLLHLVQAEQDVDGSKN